MEAHEFQADFRKEEVKDAATRTAIISHEFLSRLMRRLKNRWPQGNIDYTKPRDREEVVKMGRIILQEMGVAGLDVEIKLESRGSVGANMSIKLVSKDHFAQQN